MAVARKDEQATTAGFDAHRLAMIKKMEAIDAAAGIPERPTMTAPELRESQIASGIRPEDCSASRELMRMRYGDNWDDE